MKKILALGWLLAVILTLAAIELANTASAVRTVRPATHDPGPMVQELSYTPRRLTLPEAQAQVDYTIKVPTYLPEGVVFIGAYIIDPPYDALYPDPAGEEARRLLGMKNRARSVMLGYRTPQGEFGIYLSGIVVARPDLDPRMGASANNDPLAGEHGQRVRQGDFEFVRRNVTGRVFPDHAATNTPLIKIVWPLESLEWRGWGQILEAKMTIQGTLPESELVQIARSIR